MEVFFLGTVTIPDREESVCFLCRETDKSLLLIECCSGILRQLKKLAILERDISHIYISHVHGDHWLGLPWIILSKTKEYYKRGKATPLYLICSKEVFLTILRSTCQMFPIVKNYIKSMVKLIQIKRGFISLPNTCYRIKAIRVPHYVECYAPLIESKSANLMYSADTNINSNIWKYAGRAKVLIHETYGNKDSLVFDRTFGHSMPIEVIDKFLQSGFSRLYLVGFMDKSVKSKYKTILPDYRNVYIPDDLDKISI